MTGPVQLPGLVCTCGLVVFGPAPVVHEYLRTHPPTYDPAHAVAVLLPGRPPYDAVGVLLDAVRALAFARPVES